MRRCWILGLLLCFGALPAAKFTPPGEFPRESLDVDVWIMHPEVDVDGHNTNPMVAGGGLLGALITTAIDSNMSKKDAARITPIRDLLLDWPLVPHIRAAVEEGLRRDGLARELRIEFHDTDLASRARAGEKPSLPRLLRLDIGARFDARFDTLQVSITYDYREFKAVKKGRIHRVMGRPMRTGTVSFLVRAPVIASRKEDDRVASWVAMGSEGLIAHLQDGLDQVMRLLNHELRLERKEPRGKRVEIGGRKGLNLGTWVYEDDRYIWGRAASDRLQSARK